MSPLWRDQVRIALSPERVTLLRLGRGLHPAVTAQCIVACAPPAAAPLWRAPLAALTEALREPAWQRADAVVVLSNHFVRYALVPWDEQLSGKAERAAFARHHFACAYGAAAETWAVRQCATAADSAEVASAVDQGLLDALRETLAPARLRLASIEPYLMHAFNRARPALPRGACWFAVGEPGRLCLALLETGRWLALHSHRLADDWPQDLVQALDRERLRLDTTPIPNEVYLYTPELPEVRVAAGPWSIRTLTPPRADPAYAMMPAPPASSSIFLDYQRRWPVPRRASMGLLAIGALLTGGALYAHQALLAGIAQHEARLGELTRSTTGAIAATNDPRQLDAETQRANAILRQLAQPWDALFRALESTAARQEKTIALLAIQPDAEKRQVQISGEAKNLAAMLDYVKLLSADPAMASVHLVSHQVQSRDPQRPVRFSLSAEWRPPT